MDVSSMRARCAQLRKGQPELPSLRTLASSFCTRYAGRTVLFVGDSVQGQLASSFAMALGAHTSRPQLPERSHDPQPRYGRDQPRSQLPERSHDPQPRYGRDQPRSQLPERSHDPQPRYGRDQPRSQPRCLKDRRYFHRELPRTR
jgi:hypothetical protein